MIIDVAQCSPIERYHLMTQTIIPRPIAWVLTDNNDKKTKNVAPFSYFNAVSSDPALVMISVAAKDKKSQKDTLINIKNNKKCVIHIATESQMEQVQESALPLAYGVSEIEASNIALTDFPEAQTQRIDDAPVAFSCQLYDTVDIGTQTLVLLEIMHLYVCDKSANKNNGRISIDAKKIAPLLRLGAGQYSYLGDIHTPKKS